MANPTIRLRNQNYIRQLKISEGKGDLDGSKLSENFEDMNNGVGNMAGYMANNPNGGSVVPPTVSGLQAAHLGNGLVDLAISDSANKNSAVSYHIEYATNPGFNGSRYAFPGPSRNHTIQLPNGTYWFKAYSQYQYGGAPSAPVLSGPVVVSGAATGTLLATQGSGNGKPGETGVGFGLNPSRNK